MVDLNNDGTPDRILVGEEVSAALTGGSPTYLGTGHARGQLVITT